MLKSTDAFVLKTMRYGEADLIITHFSSDFGIIKTFAKSPRKTKSRFGSSLEPYTFARISFMGREDAQLPRLTQSDIIKSHQALRDDVGSFLAACAISEILLLLTHEREPDKPAFALFKRVIQMLEDGPADVDMAGLLFKIRFLKLKGYAPSIALCARCGTESGVNFFKAHGSVICARCWGGRTTDDAVPVSEGVKKLYIALYGWQFSKTSRIRTSKAMLRELTELMDSHIEQVASRKLRSQNTLHK